MIVEPELPCAQLGDTLNKAAEIAAAVTPKANRTGTPLRLWHNLGSGHRGWQRSGRPKQLIPNELLLINH